MISVIKMAVFTFIFIFTVSMIGCSVGSSLIVGEIDYPKIIRVSLFVAAANVFFIACVAWFGRNRNK